MGRMTPTVFDRVMEGRSKTPLRLAAIDDPETFAREYRRWEAQRLRQSAIDAAQKRKRLVLTELIYGAP